MLLVRQFSKITSAIIRFLSRDLIQQVSDTTNVFFYDLLFHVTQLTMQL